jgi:uncharacterized protein YegJ (DUF2314 family)
MLVNNFNSPYISTEDLPDALKNTKEMRSQKALRDHVAWLSFDLMEPKTLSDKDKRNFYRRSCALASLFVGPNCLALVIPETGELLPCDETARESLLAEDPLSALRRWNPVPVVDSDDVRMEAAMNEAKRRWPEFEQAFRDHFPGQNFAVKAAFRDKEEAEGEWMWILISSISDGFVEGQLLNDPVHATNVRKNDIVRIPTSAVGDWIYGDGKKSHGGFTDPVLRESRH